MTDRDVTSAIPMIPRLVSLFRLCTAYFAEFDVINDWYTNENAIYLQNLDVEYNVNEFIRMTHNSSAGRTQNV